MPDDSPFPSITALASEFKYRWPAFDEAAEATRKAESTLRRALRNVAEGRLVGVDCSLVLCGSFARYEMSSESDYDWSLLVDGVANCEHSEVARSVGKALQKAKLQPPGSTGTFGCLVFSHDLVHRIGGEADSNANLSRRMLILLESRPFDLFLTGTPQHIWTNVVSNIIERYFEEDVHFSPKGRRQVPRFLLNDLTRYWRTICVDYAAKHNEQDGKSWAMRNAKIRFSRKLLFASGLAFCLSCQLDPPKGESDLFGTCEAGGSSPYIRRARSFAETPPLEYLAAFIRNFVSNEKKRREVSKLIFGSYNRWLVIMSNKSERKRLKLLSHEDAKTDATFQKIRKISKDFAAGLQLLFFNRNQESDPIASLSLDYVGF